MQFSTLTITLFALLPALSLAAPFASPEAIAEPIIDARANTVRVQLNGNSELAVQREVAINNAITLFSGRFTNGFISNLNGQNGVTCQAYSDKAATKKVGGRFGKAGVNFNAGKEVQIAAVKCSK
ncbi:uncharacterized protein RSE6_08912 [Rhynchosporium secalis]|uniref:Uncharacterized protein n=1 Tax=Rhynchosporium secalis TaxID=38038 RepID=A0A1E1MGK9_RHYSE|nr:uncharacterized protein RSE6_08912 [Rhynchosporium secalis]